MTTNNMTAQAQIAQAINYALVSPNEADSNMEPANVTDGLFALMRAVRFLGATLGTVQHDEQYGTITSVESVAQAISNSGERIAEALNNVADALREHREAS